MSPEGSTSEHVRRLQSVTDAALAHLRLDELLGALLERTRQILEVDTCAILLLDEDTNELVARAALGIEEEVEQGVRIPVGGGFAGRIAAEKRPVILDDVDHAHVLNPILREKGIKSMLGVPLVVEAEVRGVLHVGSLTYRAFQDDEVELLQLVADRAALAIEHARLFEAERAARERIEHVQAVTDAALAHLEVDELLRVLLPRIRDILRTDTCAVLLLDPETNELVARAALGIEEEVGVRIPLGAGFAGRVADEARPLVIDVDEYPVYNPVLRQKRIKCMVGVPLLVRGASLGVLHVGTLTPRQFTRDEVELLQLVAERVAIAIERAQLHEELIQLDQLKLNFVAIASHELRSPATSVYGVLKTLSERGRYLNDELREELLQVGAEQGERLRRLVDELLDLSRLDARAVSVEPRPLVLKAALADVVQGALARSDDGRARHPGRPGRRRRSARAGTSRLEPGGERGPLRRAADPDRCATARPAASGRCRGRRPWRPQGPRGATLRPLRPRRRERHRPRPRDRTRLRGGARRKPRLRPAAERRALRAPDPTGAEGAEQARLRS